MINKTVTISRELLERISARLERLNAGDAELRALLSAPEAPRQSGCCCPPKGHTGIWAAAMCPVHHGLRALVDKNKAATLSPLSPDHSEPVAYMRNEGTPNNLVKCSFTEPGAFGVYRGPVSSSALPDYSGGAGEVVINENAEFEKWWCLTPALRKGKLQLAQEAWQARACLDKVKELNQ